MSTRAGANTGATGPWRLSAEGALIHLRERLAVVADVHLGYEWARGRGGDCLPAHSLAETLTKLARLLDQASITRLVVAGDLVESPRPCRRTAADLVRLTHWLADRGVTLIALAGNHDPPRRPPLPDTFAVAGWTIGHGHRPIAAVRTISGHDHPVLRAGGVSTPCFLVGPRSIVLPAFSLNAAGCNVAAGSSTVPPAWRDAAHALRCIVPCGADWLDFGPVAELPRRLHV
jgi:metallophosphoesterase superfamily enzyme